MSRPIQLLNILLWALQQYYCSAILAYLEWERSPKVVILNYNDEVPSVHVAYATYSNQINETGWAFLEVYTSGACADQRQAFAAGYLEGFLTRDLIWFHRQNLIKDYCYKKKEICMMIEEFLRQNDQFIEDMVLRNPQDPYWYQVKLIYTQIEGMTHGYNAATQNEKQKLKVKDIFWLNLVCDLDELAICMELRLAPGFSGYQSGAIDRCSGLVKILPDWSDLLVSHVTWNSYQSMLRLQKMYVLKYRVSMTSPSTIPGYKMSMTSYPAFVQSADDFVITSTGLVAAETTLGNSNTSSYQHIQPYCVFEFVRACVACRLARSGAEWAAIFKRYNSGTYNNQWYIVDYKQFRPAAARRLGRAGPGLLWVLEQMPGVIEAHDMTSRLVSSSYFPSYNIASFSRVFAASGGAARVARYGGWFGYHSNPRGRIIRDKQSSINNLGSMFETLRYNDYLHDPLSRCAACRPPYSACNAISARNDLNPSNGTYPFKYLGHRSHGATDAKATSVRLHRRYMFLSVGGPTYNITRGIMPFQWSKFDMGPQISHLGHPDLWIFAPLVHQWGHRDRKLSRSRRKLKV